MPQSGKLKIAVSGYIGSGKTTLCRELATRLGLHMIEEDLIDLTLAGELCNNTIREHGDRKQAVVGAKEELARIYDAWSTQRSQALRDHDRVIADRWHADLLVWWLQDFKTVFGSIERATTRLFREMNTWAAQLDYIVLTPFQKPFAALGEANSAGMARYPNQTDHLLFQSLLRGLIVTPANTRKLIIFPPGEMTLTARADFVERAVSGNIRSLQSVN